MAGAKVVKVFWFFFKKELTLLRRHLKKEA
jgi:hypothetical protein